jgi:adenylate cyclase
MGPDGFKKVQEHFERAIQLDPTYGEAYAGLALAYGLAYNNRWTDDPQATLRRSDELATKAVSLAPNDPNSHYIMSMTAGYSRDYARSRAAIDKALELNPNHPGASSSSGIFEIFAGKPAAGIPAIERAIRLDPANTSQSYHFLGLAHLMAGNYETAAAHFRERIRQTPETDFSRAMLASALGHLGRAEEARTVWAELMKINPAYSFSAHMSRLPFANPADTEKIAAGLRNVGLIE